MFFSNYPHREETYNFSSPFPLNDTSPLEFENYQIPYTSYLAYNDERFDVENIKNFKSDFRYSSPQPIIHINNELPNFGYSEYDNNVYYPKANQLISNKTNLNKFYPDDYANDQISFRAPLQEKNISFSEDFKPMMMSNLNNFKFEIKEPLLDLNSQQRLNNDQSNYNISPEVHTSFGTYKQYDLCSKKSKFRTFIQKINPSCPPLNYINMDYSKNIENLKFFELLKNFIIFERKIENLREELFSLTDYNIYSLFNFFDGNNSGQIVKSEWRKPLLAMGIKVDDEDLYLMLDRFSRDGNYAINFNEFARIIMPKTAYQSFNPSSYYKSNAPPKSEIINKASHLFKLILNTCYTSQVLRRELNDEGINVRQVFEFMDFDQKLFLNKTSFEAFFSNFDFRSYNDIDMENLIERFDRNKTDKITFKEFEFEIAPKILRI